MSTKEQTKKTVLMNFRVTPEMAKAIRLLSIDITDTCRKAIEQELIRLSSKKKRVS